ncbi:hypothetical protein L1887_56911 [Cichorium endivia]|nr:hypothetical protein L1887_56911 [Cichorium endivia]
MQTLHGTMRSARRTLPVPDPVAAAGSADEARRRPATTGSSRSVALLSAHWRKGSSRYRRQAAWPERWRAHAHALPAKSELAITQSHHADACDCACDCELSATPVRECG